MSFEDLKKFEPYFSNNEGGKLMAAFASPDILQNPYPYYHFLQSKGQVSYLADETYLSKGYYMIHDYDVITELLKSRNSGRDFSYANSSEEEMKEMRNLVEKTPFIKMVDNWMLIKDPPIHTDYRTLMNKVFTPGRLRELSQPVTDITNSLLEKIENKEKFDFIAEFAYPLPVLVIASLLGVPTKDLHLFKKWSKSLIITLQGIKITDPNLAQEINTNVLEMRAYFKKLLAERESNPAADLISALAQEKNHDFSEVEIIDNLALILLAGHETTMNLIGNGVYHLLKHPDQLVLIKDNIELCPNAVEEALRYDAPIQILGRYSYTDLTFKDYTIKAGFNISVMLASANRNSASNENPDVFDITRKNIKHVSFGQGIHYCIGAPLARLEGKIAFESVFDKFKNLQIAAEPKFQNNIAIRGLETLLVKN